MLRGIKPFRPGRVLWGVGGGSGSSSSDSIKVGIMGPFSGDVAQYGIACRNGAQLYFKQLNEKVGVNGEQIDMDVQDEKGDATEAVSVYNKLVQNGVTAIVGIASAKVSGVTGEISYSGIGDPVKSTLIITLRMARRRSSTPSTPSLMEL